MRGFGFITAGVLVGTALALMASRFTSRGDAVTLDGASEAPLWSPSGMRQRARELATQIVEKRAPTVGTTEAELMQEGPPVAAPSASATPTALREHAYRADAATLSRMLTDHDRERPALAWARDQSLRLQKTFALSGGSAPASVQIDCRSKTCVARLKFASAAAREAYLGGPDLPQLTGCHAITALPRDLANDAPDDDARVIYACRP